MYEKVLKLATRISRDFDFLAGVYFENKFLMNKYEITLTIDVLTDSITEQNIAMERIKFFIYEVIDSVVFVHKKETKVIEKYMDAGIKVCTLPEEAYDQIVNVLLFYKLNAILENKLLITDIQLISDLSDGVSFLWGPETPEIPYGQGWWTENSVSLCDKISSKKEKIVKLVKKSDWSNLGLDWTSVNLT
jgi:hypothetical protein